MPSSSLVRSLLMIALVFATFACSGGGCSGCAGCGIAPVPGGFPMAELIPNAAQVRLSSSAIAFIEENIGEILPRVLPDGLDFPVERSDQGAAILCSSDPRAGDGVTDCFAHIDVDSVELTPVEGTNQLVAHVRAIAESRDETGVLAAWQVRVLASECLLTIDTRGGSRPYVGVRAELALEEVEREARAGATRLAIRSIGVADSEGVEAADFSITHLNWWDGGPIACGIANWELVRNSIAGTITSAVQGLLSGALGEQLCTRRGELGCPTGTFDRGDTDPDAVCYFDAARPGSGPDECVPSLLGFEGRGDLGARLLGGFSPGTRGPLQLSLAAGGDGESIEGGVSLFLSGGMMSFDRAFERSPGHAACVPALEPPALPEIVRIDAFRGNVIPGTDIETHVGIGIAEDYLDHAGYGMFDSGMLCLGAGTRLSQLLSTGLVSAIAPSLRALAFPGSSAPLSLALRPQRAPDFRISSAEGEPQLTVTLPSLQIDFYVWSSERYVRFMTFESDLSIRLTIAVEGGEVVLRIAGVGIERPVVSNSELLLEAPAALAGALQRLVPDVVGMLAGVIPPISLPAIMGFELDVPAEGVRGVEQDGERFLGIFANLRLAESALVAAIDTTLEVSDLALDPESMTLEGWAAGDGNSVWLSMRGTGGPPGADYEYSVRVDGMTWSAWGRAPRVRIEDDVLLLQGRHTIEARARVAGAARSADPTPASATFVVDVIAPEVQLSRDGMAYVASGHDIVSAEHDLQYRFRVHGGEWSAWSGEVRYVPDALLLDGRALEVEVVDEAGNVGRAALPLIRGLPDPAGGGCACRASSGAGDAPLTGVVVALAIVVATRRRKRR